jgi:transcriptional regulator with XRE-family HTH domain
MDFQGLGAIIGGVIHRRRIRAHFSQQRLANLAGLERSYLSLLETGKRMPGVEIIFRLALAFGISPNTLFREIEMCWRETNTTRDNTK